MLKINPSQIDELPILYKIERLCYQQPWTIGILKDCLRVGYICHTFKVPCPCDPKNEIIIGYMVNQIILDECHLLNICIHPDFQGKGHAFQAMQWLKNLLKEKSINCIFLEVRKSNQKAQKLYKKCGFEEVGIRKNYYPAFTEEKIAAEDAIVMKSLL